jgi:hypothetical protein
MNIATLIYHQTTVYEKAMPFYSLPAYDRNNKLVAKRNQANRI